jgi:hypothetical protein
MTSAEVDEAIRRKLDEGVALLDELVVLRMREVVLVAGDRIDRPRVREAFEVERARLLAWRETKLAEIESALLAAVGKLH